MAPSSAEQSPPVHRSTHKVLLITTEPRSASLQRVEARYPSASVSVLSFASDDAQQRATSDRTVVLPITDFLDHELLRGDFLRFLETWPRTPLGGDQCFDTLFRLPDGYSVWWIGPGADRIPDEGVFPLMKIVWICDRAIRKLDPTRIVIHTADADLAVALASRCRHQGCDVELAPKPAGAQQRSSRARPWKGRRRWLLASLVRFAAFPCLSLIRAVLARAVTRSRGDTRRARQMPAVVFASSFHGHVRTDGDRCRVGWWEELQQALHQAKPTLRQRYLLHIRGSFSRFHLFAGVYHTAWSCLNSISNVAAIKDIHPSLGVQVRLAGRHLRSLVRYYRLEKTASFRRSFHFAGTDVSCFYVPRLRRAVAGAFRWQQEVASIVQSLRSVGDVRAVIVADEMYRSAMRDIAAARALGIPTVGFQHGTIFPMHVTYTLPRGQVTNAPTPDYFGAHGPYAKRVVSRCGSFPEERIWVTGPWKHDHLVVDPPDPLTTRRALGLPQDKKILLVATQLFPWFREAVAAILETTKDRNDCLICLKPHPREQETGIYRRLAEELGADNVRFYDEKPGDLAAGYDLFRDLLPACDVLLSAWSTTIYEAILLGKRTICLNFSGEPDLYPYVADGGSLAARSTEQLRRALERACDQGGPSQFQAQRRRFLDEHVAPRGQERFAQRAAGQILSLVGDRRPPSGVCHGLTRSPATRQTRTHQVPSELSPVNSRA